ncbi:hypothetical protein M9H77_12110 [Catharanthus roseus]|uniref:Uncharacterized protein n=1 Tax=Catharanthus roseus TaxID=4058 RepID=A0ACC0BGF3_CATRO|nr:hypothetical protein M9H77_12110 [Catharanthus roseus]
MVNDQDALKMAYIGGGVEGGTSSIMVQEKAEENVQSSRDGKNKRAKTVSNGADSEDDESELEGFSDSEFEADNEDEEGIWKDGLIPAIGELLPYVEHRHCMRNLHNNFKKQFRGYTLKEKLSHCAQATYQKQFDDRMEELNALDPAAADWIKRSVTTRTGQDLLF